MPKVATKGGIFIREMMTPLTKPASMPVSNPTRIPNGIGKRQTVTATPVVTADKVITVPTDRSMPAVMMTKVTPRASTPLTAVASRMPRTLSFVRK